MQINRSILNEINKAASFKLIDTIHKSEIPKHILRRNVKKFFLSIKEIELGKSVGNNQGNANSRSNNQWKLFSRHRYIDERKKLN